MNRHSSAKPPLKPKRSGNSPWNFLPNAKVEERRTHDRLNKSTGTFPGNRGDFESYQKKRKNKLQRESAKSALRRKEDFTHLIVGSIRSEKRPRLGKLESKKDVKHKIDDIHNHFSGGTLIATTSRHDHMSRASVNVCRHCQVCGVVGDGQTVVIL